MLWEKTANNLFAVFLFLRSRLSENATVGRSVERPYREISNIQVASSGDMSFAPYSPHPKSLSLRERDFKTQWFVT
jgi:hypothetical protein